MMKILLALSIISLIFVITPALGEECVSLKDSELEEGDVICSNGYTRLSSLGTVEVSFNICVLEKPEFSQAKFEISTSLDSIVKTYSWETLGLPVGNMPGLWCIDSDDVKLQIPPYIETARVNEDLNVVYVETVGINIKAMDEKRIKEGEELMKQRLTEERSVKIIDVYQHDQLKDRYYVLIEVCAGGSEQLRDPLLIIRSDSEEIQSNIYAIMAPLTCSQYETKAMVAIDSNSFVADFAENLSFKKTIGDLEERIEQLEQKNKELTEEIDKKKNKK